jgi:hypothetical protein
MVRGAGQGLVDGNASRDGRPNVDGSLVTLYELEFILE